MEDMDCCALSDDYDAERPDFYNQSMVKARKEHRCHECRDPILKGTRYEAVTGKWDGRVETYRTCVSCVEIRDHFACGNGYVIGRLWEDMHENFFPDMKAGGPCMTGLSPEAKGRLFVLYLEWKGFYDESVPVQG